MSDLEDIRSKIDKVDDEIVNAYIKRMELCKNVAIIKKNENKAVNDYEREKKVLFRITENVPDELKIFVKELYGTIFASSKSYQYMFKESSSETTDKIKDILNSGLNEMPKRATVACQGVKGANSGTAATKLFPINDITYFKTFEGVFSAVEKGFCDYGVLPIENSNAGSVSEVYDLMKKYNFYIVGGVKLKVQHCLAAVKGAKISDIKKVISHPQALKQCSEYIKNHNFTPEEAENTATAAEKLSTLNDKSVAVLCSEDCASIYGLQILEKSVQDNKNNFTRFICIGKNLEIFSGSDKISVISSLPHRPGSLNNMLLKFSALDLNLTKIESRPIPNADFEFMFYFDFNGNIADKKVLSLISELENNSDKFVFLGSYKEVL